MLATIVRGQTLDVERFGDPSTPVALQSAAELDEYTYLVAGCVGEFWTRLGFRHLAPFARRAPDEMSALGIEYGQGLQLINVLRDRGADLRAGREYLPPGEKFLDWLDRAETKTRAGIDYAASLTSWRMRFATALPALIGARTITLLREAGAGALTRKVKVSRAEVRRILVTALLASASPRALRAHSQRLASR